MTSFITLFALSQAPIVILFSYVYFKDKYDREPIGLLAKTFFAGVLVSFLVIVAELLFTALPEILPLNRVGHVFFSTVVGTALIEELGKYLALRRTAYHHPAFNEPYDGIMYCVTASLGFAAMENILYVLQDGVSTGLLRMFTAVPMHAVCGVIMGFYVGLAKFSVDTKKARLNCISGITLAVLTHGVYNYFIEAAIPAYIPLAFLVLAVQLSLAWKAIEMYRNKAPLHDEAGFYASLPPHDSLVPDKLGWAISALRVVAGGVLFWAGCLILLPSTAKATQISGILALGTLDGLLLGIGALLVFISQSLKQRVPWAWKASFGIFVIMLPSPIFIVGVTGLYGLLHPTSRVHFFT